jgi:hypothetical protein
MDKLEQQAEEQLMNRLGWLHADCIKGLGIKTAMDMMFSTDIVVLIGKDNKIDMIRTVTDNARAWLMLQGDVIGKDVDDVLDTASGLCEELRWRDDGWDNVDPE